MPLLIPFLIVNVISCGDDFVEDTGGGSIPVSYTHLDVYKRQLLFIGGMLKIRI